MSSKKALDAAEKAPIPEVQPPVQPAADTLPAAVPVDDVLNDAVSIMPDINPDIENITQKIVPELQQPNAAAPQAVNTLRDKYGTEFNKEIHAVDAAGNPLYTKQMAFARIRGRKAGTPNTNNVGTVTGTISAPVSVDNLEISAQGLCYSYYALGIAVFGEEWTPSESEHKNLSGSLVTYLRAKNIQSVPPEWALFGAFACYTFSRFHKPKTLDKLKRFKNWLVTKCVSLWLKIKKGK